MKVTDREYALVLDKNDQLAHFKSQFVITDPELCYLDGNSLGRLPKSTITAINDFMTKEWGPEVVTGWSHWVDEAQPTGDLLGAAALGAANGQVLVSDTTSVNFYQLCLAAIHARPGRKTIITDAANFPTDRYILAGIAQQFGLKLVIIDNADPAIAQHERITTQVLAPYLNDDVALVTLQVIQYRSGARTEIKSITDQVRAIGGLVLWDASHAVGAIELNLDSTASIFVLVAHTSTVTQVQVRPLGCMFHSESKESYMFQFKVGLPKMRSLKWAQYLRAPKQFAVFKSLVHP